MILRGVTVDDYGCYSKRENGCSNKELLSLDNHDNSTPQLSFAN